MLRVLIDLNGSNRPHPGHPSTPSAHGTRTPLKLNPGQTVLGWTMSEAYLFLVLSLFAAWALRLPCIYLGTGCPFQRRAVTCFHSSLGISLAAPEWTSWISPQICLFFSYPGLEMLMDPATSSWLYTPWGMASAGVTLLVVNLPLGSSFS